MGTGDHLFGEATTIKCLKGNHHSSIRAMVNIFGKNALFMNFVLTSSMITLVHYSPDKYSFVSVILPF